MKNWIFRELPKPIPPLDIWAESLNISPLLANILWKRGLNTIEAMDSFLSPNIRLLAPPCKWEGVDFAAKVIVDAIALGKKNVVWGDYDVDGITAATLALDIFEFHNINAIAHLPNRLTEGYGLNIPMIERFADEGVGLLITVDCGISDTEAIARARELGIIVVITDHHLAPAVLPNAHAICNPRIGDCPCPDLAGVGMAFFFNECRKYNTC